MRACLPSPRRPAAHSTRSNSLHASALLPAQARAQNHLKLPKRPQVPSVRFNNALQMGSSVSGSAPVLYTCRGKKENPVKFTEKRVRYAQGKPTHPESRRRSRRSGARDRRAVGRCSAFTRPPRGGTQSRLSVKSRLCPAAFPVPVAPAVRYNRALKLQTGILTRGGCLLIGSATRPRAWPRPHGHDSQTQQGRPAHQTKPGTTRRLSKGLLVMRTLKTRTSHSAFCIIL